MDVLIVQAHPEPASFNGALTDVAVEALQGGGHGVTVSDLYRMRFAATLGADDFVGEREDATFLRVDREQTYAHRAGTLAPDVVTEQAKLARADLLILQFPMWWFGMPAILKGWVDRVFTRGFAYLPGHKYDTGLLAGKLAMVSVTTGTSEDTYQPDGIDGAILDVLWPVHNGVLRYSGFDVCEPAVTYMPRRMGAEERRNALQVHRDRLRDIDALPRLHFHRSEDYDVSERLRPGVIAQSGFQHN